MSKKRSRRNIALSELIEAVAFGSLLEVKRLISAGSDVNQADSDGFTPLMCAICYNKLELLSVLLEHGADVNARNDIGQTPLMMAAKDGRKKMVQKLISSGADLNAVDSENRNAITWATAVKDNAVVISLLGVSGADYNLRDVMGLTPLMRAALMGFAKSVGLLLTLGADESVSFEEKPLTTWR